jgi:geranylgeranyl pyrophosphate synthase
VSPRPTKPEQSDAVWDLPRRLGLTTDIERLRELISEWAEKCHPEVREIIRTQIGGRAKHFRPVTLFACYRAIAGKAPPASLFPAVLAVELTHNVTLIIDDILDRSRYRRGQLALHCRFGFLPALMAAGYIFSASSILVASDPICVRLHAELLQRLALAECLQWRLRRHPLGVEDWRQIASEDTGSMFEICARIATRDERLRKFGNLLGVLYHGCDDVADVRGTAALGGGREKDIEDGILTLPAAIAVRDPETAALFRQAGPGVSHAITQRLAGALPDAERYLDKSAAEADTEAIANTRFPEILLQLVRYTRLLSGATDASKNSGQQAKTNKSRAKHDTRRSQITTSI